MGIPMSLGTGMFQVLYRQVMIVPIRHTQTHTSNHPLLSTQTQSVWLTCGWYNALVILSLQSLQAPETSKSIQEATTL